MGLDRKAVYFVTDALLAAVIILGGFLLIHQATTQEHDTRHLDRLSGDLLTALDTMAVGSINHPFVQEELANGNITSPDKTILEQAATYWATGQDEKARNLTDIALENTMPGSLGLRVSMEGDTLYEQGAEQTSNLIASRRMISGIEKGKPLQGSSSYGYLRNIQDKRTSAYAYFGGFTGQGNVTVQLEPLPADINDSRISHVTIEADLQRTATAHINGHPCRNLTPTGGNMTADAWNLTACKDRLGPGTNNITLTFEDLNDAYVGGGHVRVDYETDEFQQAKDYSTTTYHFPEIKGIINVFDAFHVPGELENLTIDLHYLANHTHTTNNTLYLTLGNTTVYTDTNSTGDVNIQLDDDELTSIINYTKFSHTTIPLRLGFENLTYSTEYVGNADVALITDVSGSMDWNFTHSSAGERRNCDDNHINDPSTQRLSVAKCLDKDFAAGILNVTGNQVGLVSYESSTDSTLGLTTDLHSVDDEIGTSDPTTGYEAYGGTCICCGINSAADMLSASLERTIYITRQGTWLYNNSFQGEPPDDSQNRSWHHPDYSLDNDWPEGQAVLGHDAGDGGTPIDTDIGSDLIGDENIADLWELEADEDTPELDFRSGLNSTANTYGPTAPNDGWDWSGGTFDYTSGFDWYGVWNERMHMRVPSTNGDDTSGAMAVTVNITQEQYDTLTSNGTARLSLEYWWDDYANYFEWWDDQVWLKGRWTSPYTGQHYLGSQQDDDHWQTDDTPEIYAGENPNVEAHGHHVQDLSEWIEGPGVYYLELGGKLRRSTSTERGSFMYDNILLAITNRTDEYYFRKHVTIDDPDNIRRGVLNLLADDRAKVWVNGNKVIDGNREGDGTYWDQTETSIPGTYFKAGDNVIAAELENDKLSARFDLELIGVNDSKDKAMMVMTDGEATYGCSRQGWTPDLDGDGQADTASDDAVQAACDAATEYGIMVYAVGFGYGANEPPLEAMALCGNGLYRTSNNASELRGFYDDVVLNILDITRQSQSILVEEGDPLSSTLYGDSKITATHSQEVTPPNPNEIELVFQTPQLENCTADVTIPQGLRVTDAKATSYSGEHWTAHVNVDGHEVFNLSRFADNYTQLGDPYNVNIPPTLLTPGQHELTIQTGDDKDNTTGCSENNTLIYTGFVNSTTARSNVVETAEGCTWTIDFEDGATQTFTIPDTYTGTKTCNYTAASHERSPYETDAYDIAVYDLLSQLDFDDDGEVFVNLAAEDLEIIVSIISDVPYLWGPAVMEVEVWQ
ncbi:MAG: hypothetical protein ACLFO2_02090 [Candidatus Woesearchaeota archaeon]